VDNLEDRQVDFIEDQISSYINWNFYALFISFGIIAQFFLKVMFNGCSRGKIKLDLWTILDTTCAVLNIVAVYLISNSSPEIFLPSNPYPNNKDFVDYFMILVLVVTWLRFFAYFLVVRQISKMLLTLISMITDTVSFLFIFSCFVVLMASVFTTLYQDTNPIKFGGLALTIRTLFDACLANYDYDNMPGREISYSCLIIFHVFMANILLMNYLIAILSTTYDGMKQNGVFKFKVALYTYCERFIAAFRERGYGELVLHPPPLTYFAVIYLIPVVFCSVPVEKMSMYLSMTMYHAENFLFVLFFLICETLLIVPVYLKVFWNIQKATKGTTCFLYLLIWTLTGLPLCLIMCLKDTANLIKILQASEGFVATKEYQELNTKPEMQEEDFEIDVRVRV